MYLACKDEKNGTEVANELKKKTGNDKIVCLKCDLASFKSVQSFTDAFKKSNTKLITELKAEHSFA